METVCSSETRPSSCVTSCRRRRQSEAHIILPNINSAASVDMWPAIHLTAGWPSTSSLRGLCLTLRRPQPKFRNQYLCTTPLYLCTTPLYLCTTPLYLCTTPLYLCTTPLYLCTTPLYLSVVKGVETVFRTSSSERVK